MADILDMRLQARAPRRFLRIAAPRGLLLSRMSARNRREINLHPR